MTMRDVLLEVAATYDASLGTKAEVSAQQLLRGVRGRSDLPLPVNFFAKGYGGQTAASSTPWIGVFDPEINENPHAGLYIAYIFTGDLSAVTLTLQQGVTQLAHKFRFKKHLYSQLDLRAAELIAAMPESLLDGWIHRPTLLGKGWRPRAYEWSSIAARRYEIATLPSEEVLADDLACMANILQYAAKVEGVWWLEGGSTKLSVEYAPAGHGKGNPLEGFRPKGSEDYIANIPARQQIKRREHEALIRDFGPHVVARGYKPLTEKMHPKDLILHRLGEELGEGEEWLVEAKVVRKGNPTSAVREAVGQLREYSYFLYEENGKSAPYLLGLFTEDIGVYAEYLEQQGIASVWRSGESWYGSPTAVAWNMAEEV